MERQKYMTIRIQNLFNTTAVAILMTLSSNLASMASEGAINPARQDKGNVGEHLTPASLEALVNGVKLDKNGGPFTIARTGSEVQVWTNRNPSTPTNDLKIESMFIAKALIEAYPKEVKRLRMLYSQSSEPRCQQIEVTAEQVKSFGNHSLTVDQLLNSLELAPAVRISPGKFADKQLQLLGRIENLRGRGTGVKPFEDFLQSIGDEVAQNANDDKISADIKKLSQSLKAQEQLVAQAERVARGRGVAGQTSTASAATNATSQNYPQQNTSGENWSDDKWNASDEHCLQESQEWYQ